MMLHRRVILGLALLAPLWAAGQAGAASAERARAVVQGLEQPAIAMASPSLSYAAKEQRFRRMLHESFDMPSIARFVLGRHWRTATPEQRRAFVPLFEDLMVATWVRRFQDYSGERLQVTQVRPAPGGFEVDSLVHRPRGQPTQVQWRLIDIGNDLKVTDIIVDGVSMAITYRADYAAVVRSSGVDGLLASMRQQAVRLSQ